jgi:hypothetical protein
MDAVGAKRTSQAIVGAHQELQAALIGDLAKPQAPSHRVCGPERSENDGRTPRQGPGDRLRIGRPHRVGEEQQARQGLPRMLATP